MVLADNVGRSPHPRGGSRERRDGPFGGLNKTVANVGPPTARAKDGGKAPRRDGGQDDRKALKMQRILAPIGYGKRTMLKDRMSEYDSFEQFDLLPIVKQGLMDELFKGMVEVKPTPVQRLALPALLGHQKQQQKRPSKDRASASDDAGNEAKSFLLAAETGSGKTLAYMLPAINALKQAEAQGKVKISGNGAKLDEMLSYMDTFAFWFNIVTP